MKARKNTAPFHAPVFDFRLPSSSGSIYAIWTSNILRGAAGVTISDSLFNTCFSNLRLLKTISLLITTLLCIFFSSHSYAESSSNVFTCGEESPSAFSDRIRQLSRWNGSGDPVNGYYNSDTRGLPYEKIIQKFSTRDLICWARFRDQIAEYSLALRVLSGASGIPLTTGLSAEALLRAAAKGDDDNPRCSRMTVGVENQCGEAAQAGHIECICGLPEAQYQLARLRAESLGDRSEIRLLCRRALLGGYHEALRASLCLENSQSNSATCFKEDDHGHP